MIRVPGRPTKLAIQHAETAIRHAVAPTDWEATGGAMLRLHSLPTVLPFLGRFEVALPVVEREHGSALPDWARSIALTESSAQEARTQPSPRCTDRPGLASRGRSKSSASKSTLERGKPLSEPRSLVLAEPLGASIDYSTRTRQKFGAGMWSSSSIAPRTSSSAALGSGGFSGRLSGARRGAAVARRCVSIRDAPGEWQTTDRIGRSCACKVVEQAYNCYWRRRRRV